MKTFNHAKKTVSLLTAALFFSNTLAFGAGIQDISPRATLAAESRLAPITDNAVMLDVMKLTAAAIQQQSIGDIGLREKADALTLPKAQTPRTPSIGTKEYWPHIKPFQYEGPDTQNRLAFQWYDPNGKTVRFSMAWWHAMKGEGADIFGWGTKKLPWLESEDEMQRARDTVDAAFELMTKLRIPYYAFHDRDVAPEATKEDGTIDVVQSEKNLREIAAYLKQKQEEIRERNER